MIPFWQFPYGASFVERGFYGGLAGLGLAVALLQLAQVPVRAGELQGADWKAGVTNRQPADSKVGITSPEDFEFVVIGDTRPRFESESFRQFESLIPRINDAKPAFVVNLGDLIYGYGPPSKEKQWDKYQAVIKAIEPPYYQVPGNHDTHSKAARKIYGRRFGKFHQSFDYGDCHFVLIDNTEDQHWGYMGPAQLEWLRRDLKETRARAVFVFMHFPVWEPERVTPEYYDFWQKTLHPLFKASRVKAVFAGHYHAYGPTREFDGIPYYITGGGGAELRPEYRKSGGQYHFMRVKVAGDLVDVRVVTEHGVLTDPEADVMGGLQFAARNVSRIGIGRGTQDLLAGVTFQVSVANPYQEELTGEARWLVDASAFSVEPASVALRVPPGTAREYSFTVKALRETAALPSLPQLEFSVAGDGRIHRFHREVRFLDETEAPYRRPRPTLDGRFEDWAGVPALELGGASLPRAQLSSCYDSQNLYLALTIPAPDTAEAKELGFSDEVQIGLARSRGETEFGNDFLRLGLNSGSRYAENRTPGRKVESVVPGIKVATGRADHQVRYEVAIPFRLIKHPQAATGRSVIMDVSFPAPDGGPETAEPPDPAVNSFSYRVRYGSDSMVPVYFVRLRLEGGSGPAR